MLQKPTSTEWAKLMKVKVSVFRLLTVPPEKFYYTSQGKNPLIDDVDDAKDYQGTRDAMKMLGTYKYLT